MKHTYKKALGIALIAFLTVPVAWAMSQSEKETKIKELFQLISDSNYPLNETTESFQQANRGEKFFPLLEELGPFTEHYVSQGTCDDLNQLPPKIDMFFCHTDQGEYKLLEKSCDTSWKSVVPMNEIVAHGAPWLLARTLNWLASMGITDKGMINGIDMDEWQVANPQKGIATLATENKTLLHAAINALRPDIVRELIARGADVNANSSTGTPLCALAGRTLFLENYNNMDSSCMDNRHCADKATTILNELCLAGATNTNCPDSSTALVEAPAKLLKLMLNCPSIDANQPKVGTAILQRIGVKSLRYPSPQIHSVLEAEALELQVSAVSSPFERLQIMLEHPRVDVNIKNPEGYTVLARATLEYPALVPMILDAANKRPTTAIPIDVNASVPKSSYLPKGGSILDLVNARLNKGNLGKNDRTQLYTLKTFIETSAQNQQIPKPGLSQKLIVKLATLLPTIMSSHGSTNALPSIINDRYETGETPLIALLKNTEDLSLVKELIGHPTVDVNATNKDGKTALDIAYWRMGKSTTPAIWEQVLIWLEKRDARTRKQLQRER